jgi:beta-xylosidase
VRAILEEMSRFGAPRYGPLFAMKRRMPFARSTLLRALAFVGVTAALSTLPACAAETDDTGEAADDLSGGRFQNPIIAMFDRPPGAPTSVANVPGEPATEGCPDPAAIRVKTGEYYIYCTSYSFEQSRHNGFPIFEAPRLTGPWTRVGSIIPDGGDSRSTWPRWVKNKDGKWDGSFWGPDVRELPNGKFVATYGAPCGHEQRCVGMAWSSHPEGPWTHLDTPYISSKNNGSGADFNYDPNLLVTSAGDLYLYWVALGHGVYGAKVAAKASGELEPFKGADAVRVTDRATHPGEGPYVIEHDGAFYEFYSVGSVLYSYELGVRRAATPLAPFEDGPAPVVQKNQHFVATGGNSVVRDAKDNDILVYHAIVVPDGKPCPQREPVNGLEIHATPANEPGANPLCRTQSERQAMIDPLVWKRDAKGIEWPALRNGKGTPSVGPTSLD